MNSDTKILVTGGTGLVGAHLLANLVLEGKSVRATYRKNSNLKAVAQVFSYYSEDKSLVDKIDWVEADVIDIPALSKAFTDISEVYHCAAMVSFNKKDDTLMRKINIEGTANMVNIALANSVSKFCYVSSIASLGKSIKDKPLNEENEWNPEAKNYGYAISKYGGEMEVWRGAQEGLNVVIVNPGVIFGSGLWGNNTGKFFSNASKSFAYYTTGETGFVGVRDVVKAMLQLMQEEKFNQRYVLVSENLSFQYIMTKMAHVLGTKPPSKKVTPLLASIAWLLAWIQAKLTRKQPLITKHTSKSAQKIQHYDAAKIKKAIGFKFEPIANVIERAGSFYKENNSI